MYVALIKKNFVLHGIYCDVVQKLKLMCINVINCCHIGAPLSAPLFY